MRFDKSSLDEIPEDFVFQVGDLLHNTRVSLDYLAFSLVKPEPNDAKWVEATGFPIFRRESINWNALLRSRLKGVGEDVRQAVTDLQPRSGGEPDALPHPLLVLDALENIHKHRYLLTAEPIIKTMGAAYWKGGVDISKAQWGINVDGLDDRPIVFRLPLKAGDHEPNIQLRASVKVCFDKKGPARGLPVVLLLEYIERHIRRVVFPALEGYVK